MSVPAAVSPMASPTSATPSRGILLLLLLPAILALAATFILPMLWLARASFTSSGMNVIGGDWTVASYTEVLFDPFYWKIALNTLMLGLTVSLCAVVLAYPIALFLTRSESRWRGVLTALAVAPLLTSSVVRTYGWMVILGDRGVINGSLQALHLIEERPIKLSNNSLGATIALVEILMPYAILAMLSGFGRLSAQLEEAAAMLGANRLKVFTRIILPLSLPGVLTGALLVFVLAISSFVTPRLMGGGRVFVLGTEVYNEATVTLNWPLAAALSVLLLVLFSSVVLLYQRALHSLEM